MTELILSRHGETLENQMGLLQGRMPGSLSSRGIEQAKELAEQVAHEQVDAIVCSDLARSRDTAAIVAAPHGLTPQATPLLEEMDWGSNTGKRMSDIDWHNLPAGAETPEELMQRAKDFLAWLSETFAGRKVVAIGHGVINRAIEAVLSDLSSESMLRLPIMKNTECKRFVITPKNDNGK